MFIMDETGSMRAVRKGDLKGDRGDKGDKGDKGDAGIGIDGKDGRGIDKTLLQGDTLYIRYDDGKTEKVGKIVGRDGIDGKDGIDGINGKDGKDGIDGIDGRGIDNVEISKDGELVLTFSDGVIENRGKVRGEDGRSIIHGGGTNIGVGVMDAGSLIGTGISLIDFTGSGISSITRSERKVVVDISTNLSGYLPLSGGSMSGAINMEGNDITNVSNLYSATTFTDFIAPNTSFAVNVSSALVVGNTNENFAVIYGIAADGQVAAMLQLNSFSDEERFTINSDGSSIGMYDAARGGVGYITRGDTQWIFDAGLTVAGDSFFAGAFSATGRITGENFTNSTSLVSGAYNAYANTNGGLDAFYTRNAGAGSSSHVLVRFQNNTANTAGMYFNSSARTIDAGVNGFGFYNDGTGGHLQFSTAGDVFFQTNRAGGNQERLRLYQTSGAVFNEGGNDYDFRVEGDTLSHMLFLDASAATENIAFLANSAPNWQSMDGGIFIANATTVPTGNPSGGGFLYAEAGALKWRGSSGTITILGAA